jgi:hypothetical protein
MPDLSKYPARVKRHVAMELLSIDDDEVFRKVVDANPDLAHRLPGEKKAKYLTEVIAKLLSPNNPAVIDRRDKDGVSDSRCATGIGGGKTKAAVNRRAATKSPRTP